MSYYQRYLAGEHQPVWDELRALGQSLFEGPSLEDARRVASATMDRVKSNVDRIAEALTGFGYEFVSVVPAVPDAGSINAAVMMSGAEALRSLPGVDPKMVEQMLASMPQLLGGLAGSSFSATPSAPGVTVRSSPLGSPGHSSAEASAYESMVAPIPLSLAAFWSKLGSVDLLCRAADGEAEFAWQPLAVFPPVGLLGDHGAWLDDGGEGEFHFDLLPNPADSSGAATIGAAMTPGADSRLSDGEWFVDHLRRMIRNAGFGVTDLPDEIRRLAGQLEPF